MKPYEIRKNEAVESLLLELVRAQNLHPIFPDDLIHAVAIMCEESGEAIQAALQFKYEGGKKSDVRKELIHTGAMVLRCLINIDKMS